MHMQEQKRGEGPVRTADRARREIERPLLNAPPPKKKKERKRRDREKGWITSKEKEARCCLAAEAVEGTALALEGVDDVEGRDGLAAGVLGVGDGVTDDVLEEGLEDSAGLLVDEAGDALDTTTACETADGGLGHTLDVVAEDLAMALGTTLSKSLTALATSRHDRGCCCCERLKKWGSKMLICWKKDRC